EDTSAAEHVDVAKDIWAGGTTVLFATHQARLAADLRQRTVALVGGRLVKDEGWVLGFLFGEALRDLRRAGRVAVAAILLITLSLAALGGFWLVSANVGQAAAHWRDRVRIIVYLKREPSADDAHALVERVLAMPGVGAGRSRSCVWSARRSWSSGSHSCCRGCCRASSAP